MRCVRELAILVTIISHLVNHGTNDLSFFPLSLIEFNPISLSISTCFPVKDSYMGFLRIKPEAIDENPITIDRIAKRLYALGFESMLREASRPKETNRQLGSSFKRWFSKIGYPIVSEQIITNKEEGVYILSGSDGLLANFAINNLGCELKKGIDLLMRINGNYLIGEAKFLTTPGGEQDRGFDDASAFVTDTSGIATRIAVLDGYVWLQNMQGLHQKIIQSDNKLMSSLIFRDFIENFKLIRR